MLWCKIILFLRNDNLFSALFPRKKITPLLTKLLIIKKKNQWICPIQLVEWVEVAQSNSMHEQVALQEHTKGKRDVNAEEIMKKEQILNHFESLINKRSVKLTKKIMLIDLQLYYFSILSNIA